MDGADSGVVCGGGDDDGPASRGVKLGRSRQISAQVCTSGSIRVSLYMQSQARRRSKPGSSPFSSFSVWFAFVLAFSDDEEEEGMMTCLRVEGESSSQSSAVKVIFPVLVSWRDREGDGECFALEDWVGGCFREPRRARW